MRRIFLYALALCALAGCDMMDYHPYDTRLHGARNINATAIQQIEKIAQGRSTLKFAVFSDTQRWYDETRRIVNHINLQPGIDFAIHCGDLTDFGITDEFEWMHDELSRLNMPYVAVLGNHDCLATGRNTFRAMYGAYDFSFNVGTTHFLCLNTNGLEFKYPFETPNLAFMETDAATLPDSIRQTVVVMHAAPLSDQFHYLLVQKYLKNIEAYPNVLFGLGGHEHNACVRNVENHAVPYYLTDCAEMLMYYIFTLNENGTYEYEEVWIK